MEMWGGIWSEAWIIESPWAERECKREWRVWDVWLRGLCELLNSDLQHIPLWECRGERALITLAFKLCIAINDMKCFTMTWVEQRVALFSLAGTKVDSLLNICQVRLYWWSDTPVKDGFFHVLLLIFLLNKRTMLMYSWTPVHSEHSLFAAAAALMITLHAMVWNMCSEHFFRSRKQRLVPLFWRHYANVCILSSARTYLLLLRNLKVCSVQEVFVDVTHNQMFKNGQNMARKFAWLKDICTWGRCKNSTEYAVSSNLAKKKNSYCKANASLMWATLKSHFLMLAVLILDRL